MTKGSWWFSEPDEDYIPRKFGPFKTKRDATRAANVGLLVQRPLQRLAKGIYRVRGGYRQYVWKGKKTPWE